MQLKKDRTIVLFKNVLILHQADVFQLRLQHFIVSVAQILTTPECLAETTTARLSVIRMRKSSSKVDSWLYLPAIQSASF